MSAIPGDIEADAGPPMAIPLRHFVVGIGFLLAGAAVGLLQSFGLVPGRAGLVHVHLLLVGWVCVTIMGAMTQFVPVWSGTTLHSRRLATIQLWLLALGLSGFAAALLTEAYPFLPVFGALVLAGFWVFVYNVGRTLLSARPWGVTERHFATALAFFLALTPLGLLLAVDYSEPVIGTLGLSRAGVRGAHATLAVFGAVLTTVLGALYQLGTMFTQSDLHGADHHLRRVEEATYPLGVVGLAVGRLLDASPVARVGGVLLIVGLLAFAAILARRLHEARVPRTPMLTRYGVVAAAMALWGVLALPAWIREPTAPGNLFGAPPLVHLLLFGVIGMVVIGTLYHVVPFIVWVRQYSDRLGLADVPMIDDLYDDRLAAIDLVLVVGGSGLLALSEAFSLPAFVLPVGGALALAGLVVFALNLVLVIHEHAPHSVPELLLGSLAERPTDGSGESEASDRTES